jgi:hypothetical protein
MSDQNSIDKLREAVTLSRNFSQTGSADFLYYSTVHKKERSSEVAMGGGGGQSPFFGVLIILKRQVMYRFFN